MSFTDSLLCASVAIVLRSTWKFNQSNEERLTAEEMQRLIDRADSDKLRKARERLLQAQESEALNERPNLFYADS